MVNCFLVCKPDKENGYRESAKKLDFKRLNKQVTEAHQVLQLIESFHVLGEMFKDPVPQNNYELHAWIRRVKKKYDALSHYLFYHQGVYSWYPKLKRKPEKLRYDEEYKILNNGKIEYNGEVYDKYSLVLPGDSFFSLGFWSHPIVLMFMNYPDSLRAYINSHIEVFIERGGKPGCVKRKCKIKIDMNKIVHPPWALDDKFTENHKAALLTKELVREEKPHYINFPDFKIAYDKYLKIETPTNPKSQSDFSHYLWPFSQDLAKPMY